MSHSTHNSLVLLLTLVGSFCLLTGCLFDPNGSIETRAGDIFGQHTIRKWLGFSEFEPINAEVIQARVSSKFPPGTNLNDVIADAGAAGLIVEILSNYPTPNATTLIDPDAYPGSCLQQGNAYLITIATEVIDGLSQVRSIEVSLAYGGGCL